MSSTFTIPGGTADGAALTVTDSAVLAASTIVGTLDAGASGLAGVDVIRVAAGSFRLGVRTLVAGAATSAPATFTYAVHDDDFDASDVLRVHDLAASGAVTAGPGGAPGLVQRGAHDPAATYAPGDVVTDAGGLYVNTATVVPDTRADTFDRPNQSGWGTASDGHVWDALPTGGLGDTPRGVDALVSSAGRQTSDSFYTYGEDTLLLGAALTGADFDMLVRWKIVTQSAPDKVKPSLLFAVSDDGSDYTGFHIDSNGIGSNFLGDAHPWKGVAYAGNGWGAFDDDTWYWTRLRVQGVIYRLRTWADGDDEPSIWHFTLTAEGAPPAGRVGLQSIAAESGAVMAYNSFSVTTSFLAPPDDPAHWQALAPAPAQSGTPVLYGPYTVDFSDIPDDGDKVTLWTPQVGDVLLRLFPNWKTVTQWTSGHLGIGQNVNVVGSPLRNVIAFANAGGIGRGLGVGSLDNMWDSLSDFANDNVPHGVYATTTVFDSTDPVQIQWSGTSAATAGHVDIYALVARAVAP